jgi:hypothetical protein
MAFCSAVWLCLAVYAAPFLQVGLLLFFGLASKYAAIKLSNDFVLSAANCARSALAHASFGSVVNHITSTISPLILVQVIEWKALTGFLFVILAIEALRFSFTHMRPGDAALEAG